MENENEKVTIIDVPEEDIATIDSTEKHGPSTASFVLGGVAALTSVLLVKGVKALWRKAKARKAAREAEEIEDDQSTVTAIVEDEE